MMRPFLCRDAGGPTLPIRHAAAAGEGAPGLCSRVRTRGRRRHAASVFVRLTAQPTRAQRYRRTKTVHQQHRRLRRLKRSRKAAAAAVLRQTLQRRRPARGAPLWKVQQAFGPQTGGGADRPALPSHRQPRRAATSGRAHCTLAAGAAASLGCTARHRCTLLRSNQTAGDVARHQSGVGLLACAANGGRCSRRQIRSSLYEVHRTYCARLPGRAADYQERSTTDTRNKSTKNSVIRRIYCWYYCF